MNSTDITKAELINLLTGERNLHFNHPSEIARKVIFSMGTALATFVGTVIVSEVKFNALIPKDLIPIIVCFVFGYIMILWGLSEHTKIHAEQRKRIQQAINYILEQGVDFQFEKFWNKYGERKLKYFKQNELKKSTPLFDAEPDTRGFWGFHDRKIEAGILLILFGFIYLLWFLFCINR